MATNPTSSRPRAGTAGSFSSVAQSVKKVGEKILDADVPLGFMAASANATSMAPSLAEIRRGSFGSDGWNQEVQRGHAESAQETPPGSPGRGFFRRTSSGMQGRNTFKPTSESVREGHHEDDSGEKSADTTLSTSTQEAKAAPTAAGSSQPQPALLKQRTMSFPNGYIVPPKLPWYKTTAIGLAAFWKWFITPFGFLVTLYGLNVVAWGGMLFLLLCGAAPAMCLDVPDGCNDINSPRRIWIEIDSQILNALFCVTGFGLVPWRARDLYWLMRYRWTSERRAGRAAKMYALRKLAGINSGWYRLPGSDSLSELDRAQYMASIGRADAATETVTIKPDAKDGKHATNMGDVEAGLDGSDERLPLPLSKTPAAPLTGVRAPPTRIWLLDWVIWCNIWNTLFQIILSAFMWRLNRYDRPSWSTGLFVVLGMAAAAAGGITMFVQGKRVKRVEGVAPDGANGGGDAIGVKGTNPAADGLISNGVVEGAPKDRVA